MSRRGSPIIMLGDDLVSLVTSALMDEEELESQHDAEENELKFDPNAVKSELIEFDADESQIDDDFLRSINSDDEPGDLNLTNAENCEVRESKTCRRSGRSRKKKFIDPLVELDLSDDDDEDWGYGSSKTRKKSTKTKPVAKSRRKKASEEVEKKKTKKPQVPKKKREIKKEVEFTEEEDMNSSRQKISEWKKVSEMNEDEQEMCKKRRKIPGKRTKYSKKSEDKDEKAKEKKKGKTKSDSNHEPRKRSSGGRRKKVSEMTEEEREIMKAKWREEARLKRERQRQRMTPEEREEYLRRHREQRRMQRAMQKIAMTEEEREEQNKKARERKREKRRQLTAEEKRERAQRVTIRRIERLAQMTEEEKAQYRMNNYMSYMARLSRMSQEEIEERRKKRREYARKRLEKLTEEDREKRRQRIRQYRWNMDPDRKERFLKQLREGYRRRVERLKAEGKWDEVKEKWRRENKGRKLCTPEGTTKKRRTGPRIGKGVRYANETPEQRAERLKEQRRRNQQKAKIKKKIAIQQLLDQGLSMEEINRRMETPEQRERRLMKSRINKAKLDLRKRLISSGAPAEEIQVKLNELAATYQPSRNFRPYKPRPDTWKPIEPDDLKLLTEPSPSTPKPKSKTVIVGTTPITASAPANLNTSSCDNDLKVHIEFQPEPSQYFHPSGITSPAEASTCSYVSAATTPEPVTILQPYTSQCITQIQYSAAPSLVYSQQPNTSQNFPPQHSQPHSFSLQQIIDTMNYHEVPITSQNTTIVFQQPTVKVADYSSSYDANSPPHISPPMSPDIVSKHGKISAASSTYGGDSQSYSNFVPVSEVVNPVHTGQTTATPTSDSSSFTVPPEGFKRRRGRPRKGDPPVIKPPKKGVGRRKIGQPIGALHKDVHRDAICDECGNSYSSVYLQEHKRNFHNPNYKNGECTLCGEKFKQSRNFYKHYKDVHCSKKVPLPSEEKKHMCESCGRAFLQEGNMRKHWYYMHGPGRLSENYHKCPVCPGERFFKQKITLLHHFRKCHPDYNSGAYKCSRCTEAFSNEPNLNEHVKEKHPEAYWPCRFCRSVKYSEIGLKFHYSNGCLKVPKDAWLTLREEIGDETIERLQTKCEFCERVVCLMNLKRHYWEMHNVEEDKFPCIKCDKTFKRREYLGAHIVDYHNMQPEEWLDTVRKLNVKDRSKVEVKNPEGKQGGAPMNPFSVEKKVKTNETTPPSPHKKRGPKRKRKKKLQDDDDEKELTEGDESNGDGVTKGKRKGRRKQSSSPKDHGGRKRRGRPKKKKVSSDEDEESSETEEEDFELDDDIPSSQKRRFRKRSQSRDDESSENEFVAHSSSCKRGLQEESQTKVNSNDKHRAKENDQAEEISNAPTDSGTDAAKDPGPSRTFNPVVPLSSHELDNIVKTEVLSDEEDVQIAWIYKD